jgi:hypothetical protein
MTRSTAGASFLQDRSATSSEWVLVLMSTRFAGAWLLLTATLLLAACPSPEVDPEVLPPPPPHAPPDTQHVPDTPRVQPRSPAAMLAVVNGASKQ